MIKSLIESLLTIVKKPAVLLAGIVFILINFAFRYFMEEQAIEVLFKFFEFSTYPVFSLEKMPFQLIASYPGDLFFLGAVLILNSVIGLMLSVSIANYIFEKKSIVSSIIYSFSNIVKILALVLFFGLILVFSVIVLWLVSLFALATGLIGAIILLLVILLMGFVLIHFAFVPALIGKGMKIKEALKESWNFSAKNIFGLILLLIAIALINSVLTQIYIAILNSGIGEDEVLMIFIELILSLIILTYSNIVFPAYYLNKNK